MHGGRAMKQPKQQQKLGALIRDLERELSEGKSQASALKETHERLRETERICHELADENRRLGEEIATWQERLAASEENQRHVSLLRHELDALRIEYARAIDRNRQMEEKLAEAGSTTVKAGDPGAQILQGKPTPVEVFAPDLLGSGEANSPASDPDARTAKETKQNQIVWDWFARNWQWGAAFAGIFLLTIAGIVTVKNFRSDAPDSMDSISNSEASTVEPVAEPISQPAATKVATVRGAFQTVRSTQVFSAPSQDSELIVNIAKGTKVNVVDSRDGWLEIRSKHGRPPGFIRQETAVRLN
jgi:Bacterial SH3 domain